MVVLLLYEGSEEIGGELKRESSYSYHVSFYKEAAIEKLSVWELDGKHSWKSLPDIHSRANNPTSRMMRFAQLSTVKAFSPN